MSSSQTDSLAAINSTTLGASMPVITLASGKKVQTGTFGALLVNIKAYDELIAKRDSDNSSDAETNERIKELEGMFRAAMPPMKQVGLLELFEPREWIEGAKSAGRRRFGELAMEGERGE